MSTIKRRAVNKPTIVVQFLIPKARPRAGPLTQEDFSPENLPAWTVSLPVVLPTHLTFRYAVNVAQLRLGLPETEGFYLNCLPEHEKSTGLLAVLLNLASTPQNLAIKAGSRLPVFVKFTQGTDDGSAFASQGRMKQDEDVDYSGREKEENVLFHGSSCNLRRCSCGRVDGQLL